MNKSCAISAVHRESIQYKINKGYWAYHRNTLYDTPCLTLLALVSTALIFVVIYARPLPVLRNVIKYLFRAYKCLMNFKKLINVVPFQQFFMKVWKMTVTVKFLTPRLIFISIKVKVKTFWTGMLYKHPNFVLHARVPWGVLNEGAKNMTCELIKVNSDFVINSTNCA